MVSFLFISLLFSLVRKEDWKWSKEKEEWKQLIDEKEISELKKALNHQVLHKQNFAIIMAPNTQKKLRY